MKVINLLEHGQQHGKVRNQHGMIPLHHKQQQPSSSSHIKNQAQCHQALGLGVLSF
jgi:hypothetical protein